MRNFELMDVEVWKIGRESIEESALRRVNSVLSTASGSWEYYYPETFSGPIRYVSFDERRKTEDSVSQFEFYLEWVSLGAPKTVASLAQQNVTFIREDLRDYE